MCENFMKHIWRYALEIFLMKKKIHLLQLFLTDVRPDEWTSGWKKKWSQGTTTTLLERFIILESSKIRERRLSYRYSWFNICVIFFNKDLESSFFFKKLDHNEMYIDVIAYSCMQCHHSWYQKSRTLNL